MSPAARAVGGTPGYRAAREGVALFDRTDLRYWRFTGRDPAKMLEGVVSGRMPAVPSVLEGAGPGVLVGEATLHTVLTPKGRMVSDLRLAREAGEGEQPDAMWAVVPEAAAEGLRAHLKRYLPPRFAKLEEPEGVAILGACGPGVDRAVIAALPELGASTERLAELASGATLIVPRSGGEPLRLVRCGETRLPAYHVIGGVDAVAEIASDRKSVV